MRAHQAVIKQRNEAIDLAAWMIGHYTSWAYHNPKKYPKKPNMTKQTHKPVDDMEEDDIKEIMSAYAEMHNAAEGMRGGLNGDDA